MRHLMGQEGSRKALGGHREAIRKASKETSTRLPPSYAVVFSRRVSRVGNLPSEEKKVVYPTVVLRFFQQKSNLRLDARHGTFILIRTLLRARGLFYLASE